MALVLPQYDKVHIVNIEYSTRGTMPRSGASTVQWPTVDDRTVELLTVSRKTLCEEISRL